MSVCRKFFRSLLYFSNSICFKQKCTPINRPSRSFWWSPQGNYNTVNYLRQQGYPFETHRNVPTEDGYLLDLHRISHGKDNFSHEKKPVVLLMHGLGTIGDYWLVSGPQHSLAFLLADKGYDVWIGNTRGTSHSNQHLKLHPLRDAKQFWNFTYHEIGYYDLHAITEHVVKITKQEKLSYIGHAQGCAAFFILTSTRTNMNDFFDIMIALAPAVFYSESLILKPDTITFNHLYKLERVRQVLEIDADSFGSETQRLICESVNSIPIICDVFVKIVENYFQFDPSKLRLDHWMLLKQIIPNTFATKQFLHCLQNIVTGKFLRYYYGDHQNSIKYGSKFSPAYDLSNVTCPVAIISGSEDLLVNSEGIRKLRKTLPNVVDEYEIEGFTPCDFVSAVSTVDLLYPKIFSLLPEV